MQLSLEVAAVKLFRKIFRKMPLIEVFFSIIALLQLVTLLKILQNFLAAAFKRIL